MTDHDSCSSIECWLPLFQSDTIDTVLIPISAEFVEYLKLDGIKLPPSLVPKSTHAKYEEDTRRRRWDYEEEIWVGDEFLDMQEQLRLVLNRFNGRVFVKTNWSAPKDASYMTVDSSLCARSVSDIFLLLKASDRVAHDLLTAPQLTLAVRRWLPIRPSSEFRCFVRNSALIGTCTVARTHLVV